MKATTSIDQTGITQNLAATGDTGGDGNPVQDKDAQTGKNNGKAESELRAAARRCGHTLKELAVLMGVNYSHLCSVANGRRPWTPELREKAMAVLGEVPGQGVVYRQGGLVQGESSFIRERAREK
ncbi:MAG: helix-turn-helix transcriptional regulator [Chloroflexi bacterium]|nr:helix-turn-helix transcriptional regulator [Chloroflexota bacterium]